MPATFYKTDSIPNSVAGDLSYPRPVDTIVIDSNGEAWRSTDASTARYVPLSAAAVNVAVTTSEVTNTNTETVFSTGTYTIPANRLQAGTVITVVAAVTVTGVAAADTLRLRVRIGGASGTVLALSPAIAVAANDTAFITCTAVVRTAGATGTVIGSALGAGPDAPSAVGYGWSSVGTSTTLDTTATQAVVCTATWSATSASNVARLDVFNVILS